MNFSQFLNENSEGGYSSFEALPKPLKDFFIDGVGKNILSKDQRYISLLTVIKY